MPADPLATMGTGPKGESLKTMTASPYAHMPGDDEAPHEEKRELSAEPIPKEFISPEKTEYVLKFYIS